MFCSLCCLFILSINKGAGYYYYYWFWCWFFLFLVLLLSSLVFSIISIQLSTPPLVFPVVSVAFQNCQQQFWFVCEKNTTLRLASGEANCKKKMFFSTALLKNAPYCSKHRKGWLGCRTEEPATYLCTGSLPHIWALAFLLSLLPAGFIKPEKRRRSPSAPWPCSMGCSKTWDLGDRSEACAHPSTAEQSKVKAHQLPPLYLCCVGSAQAVPTFSLPPPLNLWFSLPRSNLDFGFAWKDKTKVSASECTPDI